MLYDFMGYCDLSEYIVVFLVFVGYDALLWHHFKIRLQSYLKGWDIPRLSSTTCR